MSLSAKQEKIAELYASGLSPAAVAAAVPCSVTTVYRQLRDVGVKTLVAELRGRTLRPTLDRLAAGDLRNVEVVEAIRDNDMATQDMRLKAASKLMEWRLKLFEMVEVLPRLMALEHALDATTRGNSESAPQPGTPAKPAGD